jgi:hypothetical protein
MAEVVPPGLPLPPRDTHRGDTAMMDDPEGRYRVVDALTTLAAIIVMCTLYWFTVGKP